MDLAVVRDGVDISKHASVDILARTLCLVLLFDTCFVFAQRMEQQKVLGLSQQGTS